MRRTVAAIALALTVATGATRGAAAQDQPATAQSGMNHAAVVIDTGDGQVRKLCLAFPEADISGIEALQRVDTRPHRFETFSGKGSGVCMLCGVGCESGDCFCSRSNYWAYHRAGPNENTYRTSAVGASNTVVRNGDVEAWKWGTGGSPVKTSVSEVCNVPEPPARTSGTRAPTTTTEQEATTTTATQSPTTTTPPPAPTSVPTTTPAKMPAARATPTTQPTPGAPVPDQSEVAEAPLDEQAQEAAAAPSAANVKRSLGAEDGAAAGPREATRAGNRGQLVSLGAFTALLGGLLVWRSRLRRANMRRVRPVR